MSLGIYLTRTHSWWRSCCLAANKTVLDSEWYASIDKSVTDCYLWNLQISFYSVKPSLLIIIHDQCLFTTCCNTCTEKFLSSLKLPALCSRLGVPKSAQLILYINLLSSFFSFFFFLDLLLMTKFWFFLIFSSKILSFIQYAKL